MVGVFYFLEVPYNYFIITLSFIGVKEMKSPEEREQELQRLERELRQKETELRLRELDAEVNQESVQLYKTTKVKDQVNKQEKGRLWKGKAVLGLKLFGLGVVALIAVRVASVFANIFIVGALAFAGYKLFLEKKK
jgi:Flp pilus assembly protein TadB